MIVDTRFRERGFDLTIFLESLLLVFAYAGLVVVIAVMLYQPASLKNGLPFWQDQPKSSGAMSNQIATHPTGD